MELTLRSEKDYFSSLGLLEEFAFSKELSGSFK